MPAIILFIWVTAVMCAVAIYVVICGIASIAITVMLLVVRSVAVWRNRIAVWLSPA